MDYYEPNFVDEALVVLDRYGASAAVLAGGTLLGLRLRRDPSDAEALVNLKRIRSLGEIGFDGTTLSIGALATARTLSTHPLVVQHAPLLARAAASVGAPALRTSATLGGNLLSGHHAADLATALLACDATATIASAREGPFELPIERMLSPGFAGLGNGALIAGVKIDSLSATACAFEKIQTRAAFEMALVSAAVVVGWSPDGTVNDARIALGGAAPTPIRATAAEASLAATTLDDGVAMHAARVASNVDAEPVDDGRASAEYRRHLVHVLVERALRAVERGRSRR